MVFLAIEMPAHQMLRGTLGINLDDALTLQKRITAAIKASRPETRGRKKSALRCPCGLVTQDRAFKRGHACQAPEK